MSLTNEDCKKVIEMGGLIFTTATALSSRIEYRLGKKDNDMLSAVYIDKMLAQIYSNSEFENTLYEGGILDQQQREINRFFKEMSDVLDSKQIERDIDFENLCKKFGIEFNDKSRGRIRTTKRLEAILDCGIERLNNNLNSTIEYIETKRFLLDQNLEFEKFLDENMKQFRFQEGVASDFVNGIYRIPKELQFRIQEGVASYLANGTFTKLTEKEKEALEYKSTYDQIELIYNGLLDEAIEHIPEDKKVPREVVEGCRTNAREIFLSESLDRFSKSADAKIAELRDAKSERLGNIKNLTPNN